MLEEGERYPGQDDTKGRRSHEEREREKVKEEEEKAVLVLLPLARTDYIYLTQALRCEVQLLLLRLISRPLPTTTSASCLPPLLPPMPESPSSPQPFSTHPPRLSLPSLSLPFFDAGCLSISRPLEAFSRLLFLAHTLRRNNTTQRALRGLLVLSLLFPSSFCAVSWMNE